MYAKSSEDMIALVNFMIVQTKTIRALPKGSWYKYLGVLEAECFHQIRVKAKVKELYKQRLKLILKSKLSGCNQIKAVNSFAVPLIQFTAGILDWTRIKCAELDRITRRQFTM